MIWVFQQPIIQSNYKCWQDKSWIMWAEKLRWNMILRIMLQLEKLRIQNDLCRGLITHCYNPRWFIILSHFHLLLLWNAISVHVSFEIRPNVLLWYFSIKNFIVSFDQTLSEMKKIIIWKKEENKFQKYILWQNS